MAGDGQTGPTGQTATIRKEAPAHAAGFDFLHGRWDVRHNKLRERLAGCRDWYDFPGTLDVAPILSGLGNFDHNGLADPAGAYVAHSLRLYSSPADQWSVWWLDARDPGAGLGPPVVGRFEGRKVWLYGEDRFAGRPIRVRTSYEPLEETKAQWTQAFQDSDGEWEVNWIMDFRRSAT
ncbi:MAG: hypothetical protein JWO25_2819 [Alphaproteobacteria bacterium]|nr:hypothetical protein [Alphaproteobacteria bacterium]